nr:hypothetical protein [Tanacetum cinerariifolium]
TVFRVPPYPFNYPTRRLTIEEILDKFIDEGKQDLAADHLSRFENPHMEALTKREIVDKFSDEHLMVLKSKFNNDELWYVNFVNYIIGKVVPLNWTFDKRKRNETFEILAHCHSGPTGGNHSANVTAKKVYKSRFYWPSVFKDANEYVKRCDACQRSGNISSGNEMPQNNIQQGEDLIDCINKEMAFLSAVVSRFPPLNCQLRTSSNPRNQETIQDGRVTVQQVQGRQTQSFDGTGNRGIATISKENYAARQGKEKLMLVEGQEAGQILDEFIHSRPWNSRSLSCSTDNPSEFSLPD